MQSLIQSVLTAKLQKFLSENVPAEYAELIVLPSVEFASLKTPAKSKPKKQKNCAKGRSCGYSCIDAKKDCRSPLDGQAKTYADWMAMQVKKPLSQSAKSAKTTKPTSTTKPSIQKKTAATPTKQPSSQTDQPQKTETSFGVLYAKKTAQLPKEITFMNDEDPFTGFKVPTYSTRIDGKNINIKFVLDHKGSAARIGIFSGDNPLNDNSLNSKASSDLLQRVNESVNHFVTTNKKLKTLLFDYDKEEKNKKQQDIFRSLGFKQLPLGVSFGQNSIGVSIDRSN